MPLNEFEIKAIESIPVHLKPYIEARNSELIVNVDKVKAIAGLKKRIDHTQKALSKKEEIDSIGLAEGVFNMIQTRYPSTTIAEFKLICDFATLGDYGVVYTLNLPTIGTWFKQFLVDPKRHEAFKEFNISIENLVLKRSEKPLYGLKMTLESCVKLFDDYKAGTDLPYFTHPYYDALIEKVGVKYQTKSKGEVITLISEKETREKIALEAEADYIAYVNRHKSKIPYPDELNICFETMLTGNNKSFDNRVKRLMVKYYFDKLIKEGKILKELVG